MSKESALADLDKLSPEEADLLNSDPELLSRFQQKHGIGQPKIASTMDSAKTVLDNAQKSSVYDSFKNVAPSNLMKLVGVGSANAPGITGAVLNSLPGAINPPQLLRSVKNVMQNPGQTKKALMRIGAVQSGKPMNSEEIKPALAGQIAGSAIEMAAMPSMSTEGMSAKTPFQAGLKMPSTALVPGAFEKAGTELGAAKVLARTGENASDAARFRVMLQKPSGITKIAEEGKLALEAGKDVPVTNLLAYREALGKMQAEGGSFANDYKLAKNIADKMLAQKAPDLVSKLKTMAVNFAAKGNPKASFPWFTFALNPEVGLAKAATLPAVQNLAGAVLNPIVTQLPREAVLANELPKILRNKGNKK